MSIIQRLRAELEQFETEASDEIHRFIDFLRLRNSEDPLPPLDPAPPIDPGTDPVLSMPPIDPNAFASVDGSTPAQATETTPAPAVPAGPTDAPATAA